MEKIVCEDKNGDFWIEIPYNYLIALGWSEGANLTISKEKDGLIVTL